MSAEAKLVGLLTWAALQLFRVLAFRAHCISALKIACADIFAIQNGALRLLMQASRGCTAPI